MFKMDLDPSNAETMTVKKYTKKIKATFPVAKLKGVAPSLKYNQIDQFLRDGGKVTKELLSALSSAQEKKGNPEEILSSWAIKTKNEAELKSDPLSGFRKAISKLQLTLDDAKRKKILIQGDDLTLATKVSSALSQFVRRYQPTDTVL